MNSEKRRVKPSENLELGYVGEEQSVMSVTDYTPFEEEEEEEVSPFAPFLLDEDDWSCSADNQLPKETPLSTIHYSLSTQKLPSLVPVAETPYHQQLKSCAKKYFEKYKFEILKTKASFAPNFKRILRKGENLSISEISDIYDFF